MYEVIVEIEGKVTLSEIFNDLEELQNYIYYLETVHKKDNNKRKIIIKSLLPSGKIVVNFD